MYKATSVCKRSFDVILKFENLQLETQQFLKYMKWDAIIPPTVNLNSNIILYNNFSLISVLLLLSNGTNLYIPMKRI